MPRAASARASAGGMPAAGEAAGGGRVEIAHDQPRHDVGSRSATSSRCERQNRRRSVARVIPGAGSGVASQYEGKRCRRQRRQPTVQYGHRSEPACQSCCRRGRGRLVPDEQRVLRHRRRRGQPFGSGRRRSATKLRPITVQRRPWQCGRRAHRPPPCSHSPPAVGRESASRASFTGWACHVICTALCSRFQCNSSSESEPRVTKRPADGGGERRRRQAPRLARVQEPARSDAA